MFRTELPIALATSQLPRTARVLTMGSCFADSMGARLTVNKVVALVNPFGAVFQPLALGRLLRAAAGEDVDWQQHLVQARGRWQSYDLHGSIGADSPVELLQLIQGLVRRTGEFLHGADVAALTLGTAWAYRLRETGELVNNCHKQSADLFVRELLTPDDVINGLAETHAYLRRINPKLRFVLTVSPVRHLKDTLPLNAVSKSVLRVATHILSELLPDVAYFPAYELLIDDLRDYRFYADDMLHPSAVAEDYIWDKFARTYFDADFGRFRKEWAAVRQSLGHRPLHAGAPEHRQFLESTREQLEQLSLRKVDVAAELRQVRAQLAALPVPQQPETALEIEDDEERIDIGGGITASSAAEAAPRTTEAGSSADSLVNPSGSRPSRLSPEEFRAQRAARPDRPERGRRDGRGKGRVPQPSENEQFQTATTFEATDPVALPIAPIATPLASAVPATVAAAEAADLTDQEAGSKKKRRSRGGAKRTARKNALRLAAEMGSDAAQDDIFTADLDAAVEAPALAPEGQNTRRGGQQASMATQQPARRGGRRDDSGRVSREELFAAAAPADAATAGTPVAGTELPASIPAMASGELPQEGENAVVAQPNAVAGPSRNSRNRNKRKAASALAAVGETVARAASNTELGLAQPIADAAQPSDAAETGARTENRRDNRLDTPRDDRRQLPLPAATRPEAPQDTVAVAAAEAVSASAAPNAAPAKRSNRKSRAVSGGRAEKPAVDTPIIPVPDASVPRLQVAAGRMTGSSATLVEPVVMLKPVAMKAAVAKPAASKAKPVKTPVVPDKPVAAVAVATPVAAATSAPAANAQAPATKAKAPVSTKATKPAPKATTTARATKPAAVAKLANEKSATNKKTAAVAAKPVAPASKAAPKAAPKTAVAVAKPKATLAAAPKTAVAVAKPSPESKPVAKAASKPAAAKLAAVKPAPAKSVGRKSVSTAKAPAKPAVNPKAPKKPAK